MRKPALLGRAQRLWFSLLTMGSLLFAGLIEKYAAVLDIDNLPKPPVSLEEN